MIIVYIIIGFMISAIVVGGTFAYGIIAEDCEVINKRTSMETIRLAHIIDELISDIRYKCVESSFNIDDMFLISKDFGSDAVPFILITHRRKATTFWDWWHYYKIYKKTGEYFSVDYYTFALRSPIYKEYNNFDELKENLMNDMSLQIKKYNITCKMKDLEKDFE